MIPIIEIGKPIILEAGERVVLSQLKILEILQSDPDSNPIGNLRAK
jgi:hypothetical protein